MPFRFHLKRQRRYEVSSRKSYVVCVRLLDNRLIECTLTADSTGYECLENIAQRIELNEIDYFGLRYVNKKLQMRWLDLDKPIKKQLDKHSHSPLLYFGVMFYINEVENIEDSMTRYQYFLQLKSDVIEGKLPCTQQQAVLLAAYSIQAEFGDHDPDQHTPEFFKDYVILPRTMTSDEASLLELTQEMVSIHRTLQGVPPSTAELHYLLETRQLEDSYGTEFYPTKDDKGRDYLLGVSYMGISVKDLNGRPSIYFRWSDIANLTQNKRTFGINGMGSNRPIEFHLDDPEIAKYVFKMCSLQHQFYKATHNPPPPLTSRQSSIPEGGHSTGAIPDIQQSVQHVQPEPITQNFTQVPSPEEASDPPQTIIMEDGMYEQAQMYDLNQPSPEAATEPPVMNGMYIESAGANKPLPQTSLPQTSLSMQNVGLSASTGFINSNKTPMAPAYRPAPDYDQVMQRRMVNQLSQQQQQQQQQRLNHLDQTVMLTNLANLSNAQVYNNPETMAYSQPEIRHSPPSYNHHMNQIRGRLSTGSRPFDHNLMDQNPAVHPTRPVDRTSSLIIHPTYSTPDLGIRTGLPSSHFSTSENTINNPQMPFVQHYKPPPPYVPPRSSSSFPDLASQTSRANHNNSPDLVSRHNIVSLAPPNNLIAQSRFDQSVENLALDAQVLSINQQTAFHSKHNLDDTSSTHSELVHSQSGRSSSIPDVASSGLYSSHPQLTEMFIMDRPPPASPAQTVPSNQPTPQQLLLLQQLQREKQQLARKQELLDHRHQELLLQQQQQQQSSQMLALSAQQQQQQQQIQGLSQTNMMSPSVKPSTITEDDRSDTMIVHSPSLDPNSPDFMKPEHMDTLNISSPDLSTPPKYISPSQFIGLDHPLYNEANDSYQELNIPQQDQVTPQMPFQGHERQDSNLTNASSQMDQMLPQSNSGSTRSHEGCRPSPTPVRANSLTSASTSTDMAASDMEDEEDKASKCLSMGPMKMAALNGLTVSGSILDQPDEFMMVDPENNNARAPKDERRKDLEAKLEEGQVFIEFEQVPKKRPRYEVAIASASTNVDRNRFKDVLPYDDNRVKLMPTKDNPQGYINASHIKLQIAGENWWYIAAQGPMDNTAQHFWQMVWEQEVEVIAMLTKLMEHGRPKCFRYWPESRGPKFALKFGDYQVSLKFTNVSGSYTTSGLSLYHKRFKKERLVWHLQYTDWPDHGCPEDPCGFLDFLNEIEAVRRQRLMEKQIVTTIPVVVHCSAGVGRSGVTILTEIMKACFEYNEPADVPTMLMRLREQRMYMVQTVSQYSFVYQTLVEYLKGSRLI